MEATPWKLLINIFYKEKHCVMDSEEMIKIAEIKKRIKEEFNFKEEEIKNITILYIDNDGDKNLIINDEDLENFILESKENNDFVTEIKLKLCYNNNKILNTYIKEEENEKDKEKTKEEIIEELLHKNHLLVELLDMKINYYRDRIKEIISYYEKKIEEMNKILDKKIEKKKEKKKDKNKEKDFDINIIKPAKTYMNSNIILNWNDIYDDKDEINKEKNDYNEIVKKENIQEIEKVFMTNKVNEDNIIIKELKQKEFKCFNCNSYCTDRIFNCLWCKSNFICDSCHKKDINNLLKNMNKDECYLEIKYPKFIKSMVSFNKTNNDFIRILRKTFFEKDEKYNIKNLEKNMKPIIKGFKSYQKNIKEYFHNYENNYIKPKIEKEIMNKKELNDKLEAFKRKFDILTK